LCCLLLSLLVGTVSGCGKQTGSVSGKVTLNGKALPGGYVNFQSEAAGATAKSSAIQPDGGYSVSGLPVGPVKITVQGVAVRKLALPKGMPGGGESPKSDQAEVFVPPQYANAEKSGLTYDVQPGSQEHNIDLK